jgi:hypothetical protein
MGIKDTVAAIVFQKWRSAVVIKDTVAARVLHVTTVGMKDTVAAVVFTNGDALWGLRIKWRLLFLQIAIRCGA